MAVKHVRRGDNVVVISGNDKGKTGEVVFVDVKGDRVLVNGVNLRWKHKKPTQRSPRASACRRSARSTPAT